MSEGVDHSFPRGALRTSGRDRNAIRLNTMFATASAEQSAGLTTRLEHAALAPRGPDAAQPKEHFMMNHADGWMGGWAGGGMWVWTVIGVLVIVLLVVVISKLSKK